MNRNLCPLHTPLSEHWTAPIDNFEFADGTVLLIMSTPNPRSPGGHMYPLSAQQMEQRTASPAEYPCFMETGFY